MVAPLVRRRVTRAVALLAVSAFAAVPDLSAFATPSVPVDAVVRKADVVDLTDRMRSDGMFTVAWLIASM